MSGTWLELRDITAGYGAAPVVRQVSLSAEPVVCTFPSDPQAAASRQF